MAAKLPETIVAETSVIPSTPDAPFPELRDVMAEKGMLDQKPVVVFDQNEPRSLINLLPEKVREYVQEAMWDQNTSDLFLHDEHRLLKILRDKGETPNATDNRIRMKFWIEYDYCQTWATKQIEIMRIVAGVCSYDYFTQKYLKNPYNVAWLVCPPTGYMIKAEEALEFGLDQLRDILELPHVDPVSKKVDTKLADLKIKISAMLDNRVKGAVTQKNMLVMANLSGDAAAKAVGARAQQGTMEDLNRRLEAAKKRQRELLNGGTILPTKKSE